jgi:hypothetical protein
VDLDIMERSMLKQIKKKEEDMRSGMVKYMKDTGGMADIVVEEDKSFRPEIIMKVSTIKDLDMEKEDSHG